jgi:hypothetical protein
MANVLTSNNPAINTLADSTEKDRIRAAIGEGWPPAPPKRRSANTTSWMS